jgi:hypothetical protein
MLNVDMAWSHGREQGVLSDRMKTTMKITALLLTISHVTYTSPLNVDKADFYLV